MEVISYDEALAQVGPSLRKSLVLGNGFSISLRPDIFTYKALLDGADLSAQPQIRKLFDGLGTQDFEFVIRVLMDTARIVKLYDPTEISLISRVQADAKLVKEALVTAVAKNHPERPFSVQRDNYRACRQFLSAFRHIYTLNYDVLLYWTLMQTEVDDLDLKPDDGFRHPESGDDKPYVAWLQTQSPTIHYLHGALHLFDSGSEIIKYTWSRTDVAIVDQIRSALDAGKFPLFVAEGTSESKLDKIMHSAYLHKALRSLEATSDTQNNAIVIYGHSLAANDQHILRCIARGKIPKLLVSIYGDPSSSANKEIIASARNLSSLRSSLNRKYPLDIIFFNAESAQVWG